MPTAVASKWELAQTIVTFLIVVVIEDRVPLAFVAERGANQFDTLAVLAVRDLLPLLLAVPILLGAVRLVGLGRTEAEAVPDNG